MKIKNIEFDFDFMDADDMERFESEAKKVLEKCKEKENVEMAMSQSIKEECKIVEDFFDNVFGKGTSEKLFNGKMNLFDHIKCYEDLIKAKIEQQKELQGMFDKYQPNREERRSKNNK